MPVTLFENPRASTNSIVLEFGYDDLDPVQWEILRTTGCQSSCTTSTETIAQSLDDANALPNLRNTCREACLLEHTCVACLVQKVRWVTVRLFVSIGNSGGGHVEICRVPGCNAGKWLINHPPTTIEG